MGDVTYLLLQLWRCAQKPHWMEMLQHPEGSDSCVRRNRPRCTPVRQRDQRYVSYHSEAILTVMVQKAGEQSTMGQSGSRGLLRQKASPRPARSCFDSPPKAPSLTAAELTKRFLT